MIILVVLLGLLAASCGSDDADPATSGPAVDRSPGALDDALAVAGITVIDAPTGAPTGLQLTDFQVANMARELERGQGYLGAELDRLAGSPGGLPFSYLIAGWLLSAPTRTAQAAASLMGEQEWEQASSVIYPTSVLAMFAADALSSIEESGDDEASAELPVLISYSNSSLDLAAPVTGVCSELAGWFNDVLDFLFESLKVNVDDGGFLGFLGSVWNAAVDLARDVVGGLVEALTAPVIALIAEAISVIGTLSMVASLLVPWSVDVAEEEARTRFAVGDEPDIGNTFTATVDTNLDIDWPASVIDCARVAGFELPDPEDAAGSAVEWLVAGIPRYGEDGARDSTIDEDNQARFEWTTGREASAAGVEEVGVVAMTVIVTSAQIQQLKAMLEVLITAQVPVEPFGSIVGQVFAGLAGPVIDELATLVQSRGSSSVRVVFHDEAVPATTVEPGGGPSAGAALWEGNVCELLTDDQVAAVFGGRAPTAIEQADSGTVAAQDYGGASCRWMVTSSEFLLLDVFPSADVHIDELAAYDPWDRWYPELLVGIGDEARVLRWNAVSALPVAPDVAGAIVVLEGDVGVRLELTDNYPPQPEGIIAAARVILDQAGRSARKAALQAQRTE